MTSLKVMAYPCLDRNISLQKEAVLSRSVTSSKDETGRQAGFGLVMPL